MAAIILYQHASSLQYPAHVVTFSTLFAPTSTSTLRLVRHSPALLLYHEDTLAPRIKFIKRLFPETPKLLSRAPLLLTHDPETFLLPKIKQLESLLPGVDVLKVVRWGSSRLAAGVVGE